MRQNPYSRPPSSTAFLLADLIFLGLAALYAWLSYKGITLLSASGTILDSDLQTYAQGMAGAAFPESFTVDPVLANKSEANSIQNLQRLIATGLLDNENFGLALLKAGSLTIFFFYAFWYALGRHLFKEPAYAALLALCAGITVWIGWGTFWGLTHSDPVPRVFFASIFPLLFWLALAALKHPWLRPIAMLACGLAMWVHGLSALNCGAMFFCAFFFLKAPHSSLKNHAANLTVCLLAFIVPVCIFLWPSLSQKTGFSAADLLMFEEMQKLRWKEDFANFWPRLADAFSPARPLFFLCLAGFASWIAVYLSRNKNYTDLLRIIPAFLPGLFAVTFIAWVEPILASRLGRLGMGHELVRGLRFLVPLSWLLIVAATASYAGKWQRRTILLVVFCAIALFNQDRQHLAARTAFEEICGLPLSNEAQALIRQAETEKAMLKKLAEIVPPDEAIFCPEDQMPVRYVARRALAHSFKDGYVFFYNKDPEKAQKWLEIEKLLKNNQEGLAQAWNLTNASWLLISKRDRDHLPRDLINRSPQMEFGDWLLYHK